MSTSVEFVALAASWLAIAALVLVLLRTSGRQRRDAERTADRLDRLQGQVETLTATLADLHPPAVPESPSPPGRRSPDELGAVPLITGMTEPDDTQLSTARVASVTLAGPLMKAAAFSYGLRYALHEERRMRVSYAMRKELRRQRKMRRRRRAQRSPSEGWVP